MKKKTKAVIALLVVGLSYVLLSISIRLLGDGLAPFAQTTARIFVALIISTILFRKEIRISEIKKINPRDWLILLLMGSVGYAVPVYFVTLGTLQSTLLNVSVIIATIPLFVFLFSVAFFKKKFNLPSAFSVLLSILGVAIISSDSIIPRINNIGIAEVYLTIAASSFAVFYVLRPKLSKSISNKQITLITIFIAFICSLITLILSKDSISISVLGNMNVVFGLLIGGIANILTIQLVNYAFENIDPTVGSQVLLSENIFALIIGFVFYSESMDLPKFIGAIIIVGSVYLSNAKQNVA